VSDTPEEQTFVFHGKEAEAVAQAIRTAVEDERKACEQIARDEVARLQTMILSSVTRSKIVAARDIADDIKARGE